MFVTFFSSLVSAIWLLILSMPAAFAAKVYLAGDSTMAKGNGKIEGWGEHLQPFLNLPVVNKAIGGRSARSYTVEGRFQEIAKVVAPGDTVVIEFGHNDGGTLNENTDNGRTDCPGTGAKTCQGKFKGERVTVKTFPAYMTDAGNLFAQRGAKVVFSSMTPNNIWEGGSGAYSSSRFTDYARDCAKAVKGASFVDHGTYVAKAYKALGASAVNAMYPQDHTHTNLKGAQVVAEAFVKAAVCAKDPLAEHVKGKDFGGC